MLELFEMFKLINSYKTMKFSVDLIESALNQINFLKEIDKIKVFYSGKILERAIIRYEKYWLPLCAKIKADGDDYKKFYPPLDVAWVWHCHMLSPTSYINDSKNVNGFIIDTTCLSEEKRKAKQNKTMGIWEKSFNASFDYSDSNPSEFKFFKSRINYNLYEASNRQKSFYYQVSLDHFKNRKFLAIGLERYKKFLYLKKMNPNAFVVPCYATDIIWHSHQLNPKSYSDDTIRILGNVFPHDDTVNDRTPGSKLCTSDAIIRELWAKTFNEMYFMPGN